MPEAPIPKTPPGEPVSQIQTTKPFVAFQAGNVPPSQQVYLQLNDNLLVRVLSNINNQAFTILYRYLTPQGDIKEGTLAGITSTAVQNFLVPLGEAWLISLGTNMAGGGALGNWTHVQVGIQRNVFNFGPFAASSIIWEGFIQPNTFNGWPGTPSKEITDGPGMPHVIVGTVPGVGADISETVPSLRRWQLLSLRATLTCSAAVANRVVSIFMDDGSNVFHQSSASVSVAAGSSTAFTFATGLFLLSDGVARVYVPLMNNAQLKGTYRIKTFTTNLQAGDQWTGPIYEVLEWGSFDI